MKGRGLLIRGLGYAKKPISRMKALSGCLANDSNRLPSPVHEQGSMTELLQNTV